MKTLFIFLSLTLLTTPLHADTIYLKNGRTVEGIIEKETKTSITVNIGIGTTKITANKIRAIKRSKVEEDEAIAEKWSKKNYLHRKNIPDGFEDIANDFKAITAKHTAAVRARKTIGHEDSMETELRKEIIRIGNERIEVARQMRIIIPAALREEYATLSSERQILAASLNLKISDANESIRAGESVGQSLYSQINSESRKMKFLNDKIKKALPDTKKASYNRMAETMDSLLSERVEKETRLASSSGIRSQAMRTIADYIIAFPDYSTRFKDRATIERQKALDDKEAYLLDRIEATLSGYKNEINEVPVQTTYERGSTYAQLIINGAYHGRFLLDTGASLVTMSEAFARGLNIDTDRLQTIKLVVADGRTIEGKTVMLESVQMGKARAEWVQAAIVPGSERNNVDGLLGMSFLRHFVINLEGGAGKLVLNQFNPK